MSSPTPTETPEPVALLGNDGPTYLIDYTDEPIAGPVDQGSKVRDLLSGSARMNPAIAFLLALIVTALVAVPLWIRANDVPPKPAVALPGGITVVTETVPVQPLHDSTISGLALIRYVGDQPSAVAFTLAEQVGGIVSERVDAVGPEFDFLTNESGEAVAFDTSKLDNGIYELLVAVTDAEGNEALTAALFRIDNDG